jgi:hypothetical protein
MRQPCRCPAARCTVRNYLPNAGAGAAQKETAQNAATAALAMLILTVSYLFFQQKPKNDFSDGYTFFSDGRRD